MDPETRPQSPPPAPKSTFKEVDHSLIIDLLSGTVSGLIGKGLFYPLENLQRTAAEQSEYKTFKRREAYFSSAPKIFQEGGILGLFKGFVPTTMKYSLFFGSSIALFYEIKYTIYPKETITRSDISIKGNILSGMIASLMTYTLLTPLFETQNAGTKIPSVQELTRTIKSNKISGLYRNWKFDVPAVLFSQGLLIGLYESKFKKQYYYMQGRVPLFLRLCDAYALALFCGFCSYPFEYAKKRLNEALKKSPENPEVILRQMAQKEGSKAFLKGISGIFLTQMSSALTLSVFYTLLEKRKDGKLP